MPNTQHNATQSTAALSPQQSKVLLGLAAGESVANATKQARVDRTTYYRWLKSDAHFRAELNRTKQEQVNTMRSQLCGLGEIAVTVVREMLTGTTVPAGVRLKAALSVLQSIGTLEPEGIGETDPDKIESNELLQEQIFGK